MQSWSPDLDASQMVNISDMDGSWVAVDVKKEADCMERSMMGESMLGTRQDGTFRLLEGEQLQGTTRACANQGEGDFLHGTVVLTDYRFCFFPASEDRMLASMSALTEPALEVPLGMVAAVQEVAESRCPMPRVLEVQCKHFCVVRLGFAVDANSCALYQRLLKHRTGPCLKLAFALHWRPARIIQRGVAPAFSPVEEYTRLGLLPRGGGPGGLFRLSHANAGYRLSPTYPAAFVTPASMSDAELQRVADFRARGRLPAITFRHPNGALLARSSQPQVGLMGARCLEDEKLVSELRRCSPDSSQLHIIDCRNQTSAYANFAIGAGFESTACYSNVKVQFMGIENIHTMRNSFARLFALCRTVARDAAPGYWLSSLECTRWLDHVRLLLSSAARCAELLQQGSAVLVHCSDGWDRTAQLSSLTQLLLDPYFRTIKGFAVLVEKEWCAFGHMFDQRCGHSGQPFWQHEQCSPVFLQFVDAVWQLTMQFPDEFEFNSAFLVALMDELYACRTSTFLGDCEADRTRANVRACIPVWAALAHRRFVNPTYRLRQLLEPVEVAGPAAPRLDRPTRLQRARSSPPRRRATLGGVREFRQALAPRAEAAGAAGEAVPSTPRALGAAGDLRTLVPDCHPSKLKLWEEYYLRFATDGRVGLHSPPRARSEEHVWLLLAKLEALQRGALARKSRVLADSSGVVTQCEDGDSVVLCLEPHAHAAASAGSCRAAHSAAGGGAAAPAAGADARGARAGPHAAGRRSRSVAGLSLFRNWMEGAQEPLPEAPEEGMGAEGEDGESDESPVAVQGKYTEPFRLMDQYFEPPLP